MRGAVYAGGLAAVLAGIVCVFVALILALSTVCADGALICRPEADGTPWLIAGLAIVVAGAVAMGWASDD